MVTVTVTSYCCYMTAVKVTTAEKMYKRQDTKTCGPHMLITIYNSPFIMVPCNKRLDTPDLQCLKVIVKQA